MNMSKLAAGTGLALILILSACDGDAGNDGGETKRVVAANPFVDRLKGLNELDRGLALRRAIQDSRQRCKKIEQSGYQQDYKNMSMWVASCSDSGEWALFIAPNGDVQVRSCKDVKTLRLAECRLPNQTAS
jgi:hypothetical protein